MSLTEFAFNPQASDPSNYSVQRDGFNAELSARMQDVSLFADYMEQRSRDPAGQTLWVTGADYVDGQVVYSPTDRLPYQANKDITNSTTDPEADGGTDWDAAGGVSAEDQAKLDNITVTEDINLDEIGNSLVLEADGAVTAGEVLVLNSDGTVSGVGSTVVTPALGTPDTANTTSVAGGMTRNIVKLGDGKYFLLWEESTSLKGIVAEFDGATWSYGTEATILASDTVGSCCAYDETNGRIIVGYELSSNNDIYLLVCTVSGTTITANTGVSIDLVNANGIDVAAWDGYAAVIYGDSSSTVYIAIATTSDTTVTAGTPVSVGWTSGYQNSVYYDDDNDQLICSGEQQTGSKGYIVAVTYSGTVATAGTKEEFLNARPNRSPMCRIAANKWLLGYADATDDSRAAAVVVTVSGTTFTLGTPLVLTGATYSGYMVSSMVFIPTTGQVMSFYSDEENSYYRGFQMLDIDGTTITKDGSWTVIDSTSTLDMGAVFDSSLGKVIHAFNDNGDQDDVIIVDIEPGGTTTDAGDWIGTAGNSAADTEDVIINSAGKVDTNQSGLTIGTTYYVADDGSLETSASGGRKIGKAVAADKLYITERRAA